MNRCLAFIFAVLAGISLYSQKIENVSATYTYYAPETMSVEEAKRTALERAKIQAIADKFGTTITQSTSTRIINNGEKSNIDLFSTGVNEVGGEWIETIGNPVEEVFYEDNMLVVRVNIKGKAKALSRKRIPLVAKVLRNCTDARCESDEFNDGDDLFLYFQTPVDGNLLVYLLDYTSNAAYCLLPYSNCNEPSQVIEHDRQYTFFSENHAEKEYKSLVDQYTLTCDNPNGIDFNDVVIIFSSEDLIKSNTERRSNDIPRLTNLADFEKWKVGLQSQSSDIQIITKPIKINK